MLHGAGAGFGIPCRVFGLHKRAQMRCNCSVELTDLLGRLPLDRLGRILNKTSQWMRLKTFSSNGGLVVSDLRSTRRNRRRRGW
jgi:hypothetical protein